jgi:hypothetical protein
MMRTPAILQGNEAIIAQLIFLVTCIELFQVENEIHELLTVTLSQSGDLHKAISEYNEYCSATA